METGKWRNLEQLGQNKNKCFPKKAKEGWEGGQLTGQGGSESQIKSSRRKKKKKSRFCRSHVPRKTRFLRADTQKKEKRKNETAAVTNSVFFSPSNFYPHSFFIQFLSTELFLQSSLSCFVLPLDTRAREGQERARDTSARARALAARDPQGRRLFCRQTIPSSCSDLQFAIFALRNDSFFRVLCKWTSN